jgi:cytochrome c-type biogenesis protein CcmF
MWASLPEFGSFVLLGVLLAAAYTFAVSLVAARGRPRWLEAARLGAYGTSALVLLAVALLAYAFVTHDFRIRYVAQHSDRSMSLGYLVASLWGGQDGSILWWLFLLSGYVAACVRWLKGRYRQLQPYVIATLMVIMSFFVVLMLFAANPFETTLAGAPSDGQGLNELLRNYYMIIHPPSLYMGFVGCTVPFSFAIAALITGRLDNEWIVAVRKWMLFAWIFLTIGNALGMKWAYEVLGWGGYWAWDPVENAACLPWFTASAYVHSTMIQERRGMFRVWNVFLIGMTFFLTIFGTFLTRSGLISSVHSFAQSDIGVYFVWFMAAVIVVVVGLIAWRLPMLTGRGRIESLWSREAAFVLNNWALLGAALFIAIATVFPKISEGLWNETVTVGPPFYNRWMAPIGLLLLLLMGTGPLFGWRKTSPEAIKRAFIAPTAVALLVAVLHLVFGSRLGMPAIVTVEAVDQSLNDRVLRLFGSVAPLLTVALVAFNFTVVIQEYTRGIRARQRNTDEGLWTALTTLVARSRRRYGGYIVHVGVGLMFLGFVGKAWDLEQEASLAPGESVTLGEYKLRYDHAEMAVDEEKRMVFAHMTATEGDQSYAISPAQFIYNRMGSAQTEVAMVHGLSDDLYVVVGSINPTTKRATFRFHLNPLVLWIWVGVFVMIGGATVSLWPEVSWKRLGVWGSVRLAAGAATAIMLTILFATTPARAFGPDTNALSKSPSPRLSAPAR